MIVVPSRAPTVHANEAAVERPGVWEVEDDFSVVDDLAGNVRARVWMCDCPCLHVCVIDCRVNDRYVMVVIYKVSIVSNWDTLLTSEKSPKTTLHSGQ